VDAQAQAQIIYDKGGDPRYFLIQSTWSKFPPNITPAQPQTQFPTEVDPEIVSLMVEHSYNYVTVHWDGVSQRWLFEWMNRAGGVRRFADRPPALGALVIGVIDLTKQKGGNFIPPDVPWAK